MIREAGSALRAPARADPQLMRQILGALAEYEKVIIILARLEPLLHLRPAVLSERHDEERIVRSLHFRLTNEERAALVADYEAGLPTTELTTRYGLAKGRYCGCLRKPVSQCGGMDSAKKRRIKRGCCTSPGCRSPPWASGLARRQQAWRGR